ncbi:MAG: PBP1A family penicillin-binding protein [bacterium]|nr:PBP1A family penicillin-binding protein [bacterium]
MPKGSKKKKRPPPKKVTSLKKLASYLVLLICAGFAVLFLYIDQKIKTRLNAASQALQPGVYGDSYTIYSGTKISLGQIQAMIERRKYTPSISIPKMEGEYFKNGTQLEFITRTWLADDFSKRIGEYVRFNSETSEIKNFSNPNKESVTLEPELITSINESDIRTSRYKNLSDIPTFLPKAVIAIEDERFYSHIGLDFTGIFRALLTNISAGRVVQGGSTVTQQLAKNMFFSADRTIWRKIAEATAAINLELRLTKERIMELYLNEVYFGQVGPMAIHGVGEAARSFFNKDISDLTLSECAILAGIIKAPSFYSPRKHPQRASSRMKTVLKKMHQVGFISDTELRSAARAKISVFEPLRRTHPAPFFIAALKGELANTMNLDAALLSGASIYTGINLDMQECAESAVLQGLEKAKNNFRRENKEKNLEVGLVSIDVKSGKVKAWVGGSEYTNNQFDHVVQAKRQVGSTIKPFLYLTALDPELNTYKVATPISLISDRPLSIDLPTQPTWEPENFNKDFNGDVTLRYAFENSLNIPAVYIGQKVGIDTVVRTIESFGVSKNILAVPSVALGAIDTTLLQLTTAYAALANGGIYANPELFSTVRNDNKEFMRSYRMEDRVASEDAVYLITDLMMGVIERGTGKAIRTLGFKDSAAGKTGTSNDARDAWFVGFTPDIATGIWIGYDDNSRTGLTGGIASAPIWAEYMKCIKPLHEKKEFIPPSGVIFLDIDYKTQSVALPGCQSDLIAKEVFLKGTEPLSTCPGSGYYGEESIEKPNIESTPKKRKSLFDILFG